MLTLHSTTTTHWTEVELQCLILNTSAENMSVKHPNNKSKKLP